MPWRGRMTLTTETGFEVEVLWEGLRCGVRPWRGGSASVSGFAAGEAAWRKSEEVAFCGLAGAWGRLCGGGVVVTRTSSGRSVSSTLSRCLW